MQDRQSKRTVSSSSKRRPGRPPSSDAADVRERLLRAARELVIEVGFDRASMKDIAGRAGVNPAMINYYFESKAGLGDAMMRRAIAPLIQRLERFAVAAGPAGLRIRDFLGGYMRTIAEHPALPQLIVREVLPVNGRFRHIVFDELAKKGATLLPAAMRRARAEGQLRADVDETLATVSLISLAAFPFLAAPVLRAALEIDVTDAAIRERLIEHSIGVLESGLLSGVAT